MSQIDYFTNDNYDVILYEEDNKVILERKDDTGETHQLIFKQKETALNFLRNKQYKCYRVTWNIAKK